MPAREAALWKLMRDSKLPGHWVRVENRIEMGTPDVNFASRLLGGEGWLELKSLGRFPADPTLPFHIRHFTRQQRFWLLRRAEAGAFVALLLRVERGPREYLLLPGRWAAERLGEVTAEEARRAALGCWGPEWRRMDFMDALVNALK